MRCVSAGRWPGCIFMFLLIFTVFLHKATRSLLVIYDPIISGDVF